MKPNDAFCLKRGAALFLCIVLFLVAAPAIAGAGDSLDWALAAQIGGTTKSMLLEGDTLYIGTGLHVMAMDVSTPANPIVLGQSPLLPDFVESIAAGGSGLLLVSCGRGGLAVLDVCDPSSIAILSTLDTPGYTESAAQYGDYAILADGPQGVQIANLTDIASPGITASAYPLAYAYDIAIQGSAAYAAGGGSGLFVVDLADPAAPVEAGLVSLDGFQYGAEIAGNRLYMAGAWGGISVLNLDRPLEPVLETTVNTAGWAMAAAYADGTLLVMDGADGAALYDVSGQTPELLSTYENDGFVVSGALSGTTAFILDEEKGFYILDYSNKKRPKAAGRWIPLLESRRLDVSDGVCYVAGGMSGVHAYDISSPEKPLEIYTYDTGKSYAIDVQVHEGYLYATARMIAEYPVLSFNISDPQNIQKIGAIDNVDARYQLKGGTLNVQGQYLFASGICPTSIDISDPADLQVVNFVQGDDMHSGDVRNTLFAVRGSEQIMLVDISDPEDMQLLSMFEEPSSGSAIRFISDTMFITSTNSGVRVFDVSDPSDPRAVSSLELQGDVSDIFLDGGTAYCSARSAGVYVVDVSNPQKLQTLGLVPTLSDAWDCYVTDDLMFVADSFAGLSVYRLGGQAAAAETANGTTELLLNPVIMEMPDLHGYSVPLTRPQEQYTYVVTSAADSGSGTLRDALNQQRLKDNTYITFDPDIFPADHPATIALRSDLPPIDRDFITIDASNAGVILDGNNQVERGLDIYGRYAVVMGLQIRNFNYSGIMSGGAYAQIGGNRNVGSGPVGQGNQVGLSNLAIGVEGCHSVVQGNLVGVDVTGTQAEENWAGIFVMGNGHDTLVGGAEPGEGNVVCASTRGNITSWSDRVRIVGNIVGLDITGTMALAPETPYGVFIEMEAVNNTVGGTTPQERNVISGVQTGIIFGDQKTYQASATGNYIGTDITGTEAIPNMTGFFSYVSYHNRIGGTAPGEGNVISGNENTGIDALADTPILGNIIGLTADGVTPLPNDTAISLRSNVLIGGYTPQEGNRICGGSFSILPAVSGVSGSYIAGNTFVSPSSSAIWLNGSASELFVQNNTFCATMDFTLLVEGGIRNSIRGNTFSGGDIHNFIGLTIQGNDELAAPNVISASGDTIRGTACALGAVEIYVYENDTATPIGRVSADQNGNFVFQYGESLSGKRVIALVSDDAGNTSAFSSPVKVK